MSGVRQVTKRNFGREYRINAERCMVCEAWTFGGVRCFDHMETVELRREADP